MKVKKQRPLTSLEFAILGLVCEQPRTGYAVMKVFADTPLGRYGSSPGSIYPALARLEGRGLLTKDDAGPSAGRTSLFHPTDAGTEVVQQRLTETVTASQVAKDWDDVMLRFALLDQVPRRADRRRFVETTIEALVEHLGELRAFRRMHASNLVPSGRRAFEHGIRVFETHLRWARRTLDEVTGDAT